ncbi:MAG: chromosome segregation protein SMC [Candidatus Berkiellales bacterium]
MRLSKIKLAGFKSFVDPTTINLMSNLTAVVGPNGCGKSNVIDAVRWVMGESSAKHLRGGALTDVIFSGSSARKPVGLATVELLFENAEGKLGGEYSNYAEIAIKRQVTREGESTYFMNGQKCRRKDITDIFLGTGLGPRSYAIIEQGMISRVIDAKPEELRVFIEEAAGISKYKERRRETENRIKHTHENLARLNDLRDELANQIRHLERQSQAAERYRELKTQEQERSAQLAALTWKKLDETIQRIEVQIRETLTELEKEQANLQQQKTEQEKQRIERNDINENLNDVQKRYYSLGGEIAKIEQALQHQQERENQLKADKSEAESTLTKIQSQLALDEENNQTRLQQIADLQPQFDEIVKEAELTLKHQHDAEATLENWREKVSAVQEASQIPSRIAEAEKAKIAQLERQIHQTNERQARLEAELTHIPLLVETPELAALDEKIDLFSDELQKSVEQLEIGALHKDEILARLNLLKPQIKECQNTLNETKGQAAALNALQEVAFGKNDEAKSAWLAEQHLDDQPYLAEKITVSQGFENAVEMVLEGFLNGLTVADHQMATVTSQLTAATGGMSFVEWQNHPSEKNETSANALVNYVKGSEFLPESLFQLLANVQVCQTLNEAEALLATLPLHQSVITPEGYWLGHGWVTVKDPNQASELGILYREEKLKQVEVQIDLNQKTLDELQQQFEDSEVALKQLDAAKEDQQHQKNKLQQELMALQSERRIKHNRIEQNQKRHQQVQQELAECQSLVQSAQQEVNVARSQLAEAIEQMAQLNSELQALNEHKGALQEAVVNSKIKAKENQTQKHQIELTIQNYHAKIEALTHHIQRGKDQIISAEEKLSHINASLKKNDEPLLALKLELEMNLEKRLVVEDELNQVRDDCAMIDNTLRTIEGQMTQHENKLTSLRDVLEKFKMEWQACSVRRENALEKLKNTTFVLEALLANLPLDANETAWQQELNDIQQKIQRLGAINLAAIDEFNAATERKQYLDSQLNDLTEALTTLESAIKKIDRESRAKFKETFDKINAGFMQRFPQLFGGGQATLSMLGEDLLDTGVGIIARPPGKKNSSIQLLSGGEKALTAVALVFSIFELNPAPFCLLDEVDAPLDDNNVGRFCDLVKEMAKKVQFVFVSHNKLAIEMAAQLLGVTMREPGVSRLVTVDMEEAKSMAESSEEREEWEERESVHAN